MSIGSGEDAPAAMAHAPPMQAVGIHGLVGQFDPRQEEWCDYIERLIHYFVANDIAEEANNTPHSRGTRNVSPPEDSSVPAETGRVALLGARGPSDETLQPETVTYR